jgi:hypothetical protein
LLDGSSLRSSFRVVLGERLRELKSHETEIARSEVSGKFYKAKSPSVIQLVAWINNKLKERAYVGQLKIGEEMADLSYGEGSG